MLGFFPGAVLTDLAWYMAGRHEPDIAARGAIAVWVSFALWALIASSLQHLLVVHGGPASSNPGWPGAPPAPPQAVPPTTTASPAVLGVETWRNMTNLSSLNGSAPLNLTNASVGLGGPEAAAHHGDAPWRQDSVPAVVEHPPGGAVGAASCGPSGVAHCSVDEQCVLSAVVVLRRDLLSALGAIYFALKLLLTACTVLLWLVLGFAVQNHHIIGGFVVTATVALVLS